MEKDKRTNKAKKKDLASFFHNIKDILFIIRKSSPSCAYWLLFCNIVMGAAVPFNIYIWKGFIDASAGAILTGKIKEPVFWIVGLCCLKIINELLNRLCNYFQRMQSEYLNKYVSNLVMNKVSELDMSYFDGAEAYDMIEKVNRESVSRCMSILVMLINFVRSATALIGAITLIMSLNPIIVILSCVSAIPAFYAGISISLEQYKIYIERLQKLRYVYFIKNLCVNYENIKEMKIYRAGRFMRDIMNNTYDSHLEEDKKIRKKYIGKLTLTDFIQKLLSYGLKVYILFDVISGKRTVGELTMYISALDNLEGSVYSILDVFASLFTDNLYIENLMALINARPNMENGNEKEFTGDFSVIEFRNVSFIYPRSDKYSLRNINLKIEKNKAYALVGTNGSGKTTLIKLLMRLYDPTEGEILVDGVDLKKFTLESLYKKIGVIFQDYIKYPLNVTDNIGIGNIDNIGNSGLIAEAAQKAGADGFINKLPKKYETFLHKEWDEGVELSVGQWQKIAVSRAFANDEASILVLDEPSAALDPKSEYEVFRNFKEMMPNKTSILITHRFSNVKMADKIIVIQDGQIIESGTHKGLILKKGAYYELYSMQAESYMDRPRYNAMQKSG